jgi:hypothetical protein
MFYTTIEESEKLVELGLQNETCDMHWNPYDVTDKKKFPQTDIFPVVNKHTDMFGYKHPCWSQDALLNVLSKFGFIYYWHYTDTDTEKSHPYHFIDVQLDKGMTAFETPYDAVVYILENKLLKK